jgi:hypothetical protein
MLGLACAAFPPGLESRHEFAGDSAVFPASLPSR